MFLEKEKKGAIQTKAKDNILHPKKNSRKMYTKNVNSLSGEDGVKRIRFSVLPQNTEKQDEVYETVSKTLTRGSEPQQAQREGMQVRCTL